MPDRESNLPLTVGFLVGLLVCVFVLPTWARAWLMSPPRAKAPNEAAAATDRTRPPTEEAEPIPPENKVRLGDDKPRAARVAWISYDDYRDLLAPQARTEQPALQRMAEAMPQAPNRLDATDPSAAAPEPDMEPPQPTTPNLETEATAAADTQRPADTAEPPAAGQRQPDVPKLEPLEDGQLARAEQGPRPVPGPQPQRTEGPKEQTPPKPAAQQAEQQAAATTAAPRPAQPTASPKSDREASPFLLKTDLSHVQAGRVITGQGVKIQTVAPRISAVTYLTTLRGGVRVPVRVVFDKEGRVLRAQLVRRSGYPEVDTPIRTSLYRWKAAGKMLEEMDRDFQIDIDVDIRVNLR